MSLQIENLQVRFGSSQILKDIQLSFNERKLYAIIGPSGCGKTTLLKSLNRTLELERGYLISGKVKLYGEDIYEHRDTSLIRQRIGLVFQTPVALPLSIKENVLFGVRYFGERNKTKLNEICEKCLQQAGLWEEVKDKLNNPAKELSGGQIQRLSIARVLAVSPEVLLLDEPCSNLDPAATQMIEELLKGLAKQLTIILVTHNLFQAKRVADVTTFLLNGQVVEVGETETLFLNPQKQETKDFISGLTY
ncbi:phosphate ABC transporter ATP-binding protein [Desulforamulus aeronauticus]|uniref:Phosphate ABC transporter ATP-binding protein, PhoT family n=1 Tax=Desulforamulus aeronauticus DSM 10349 TaxID=1121421 RepID=A0A1M6VKW5_9FIRM|nr:phosphate ABC transporter ATP-binding protein [Desulforamulus aeronauticus]SHK82142.1 phosphate ABC transporter ATP-binding protein, PhoT family [Desulforamulus aeronauticus DSM 10349]